MGRPREAQETIEACHEAGMTSQGVVFVDADDRSYDKLRVPANWIVQRSLKWVGLQGSMQWTLEAFPDATQYGWLADDTRPRTDGWDKRLEEAAGNWCLAYARDLWFSENPGELALLEDGRNLSSGLCWGGKLVRTVGWWALPGVMQAGIDTAWCDLVRGLDLHRYVPSVTVEHLNWRTGKRGMDDTDRWDRDGNNFIEQDLSVRNEWAWSGGFRRTFQRLAAAYTAGREFPPSMLPTLRQARADETFGRGSLTPARLQHIMEGRYDADDIAAIFDLDANPEPARVDP